MWSDPLGNLLDPPLRETEIGRREVRRHRLDPLAVTHRGRSEQPAQDAVDAVGGGLVVRSPNRRDHALIASLEVSSQHFHADEAGCTGKEERPRGHGCASGRTGTSVMWVIMAGVTSLHRVGTGYDPPKRGGRRQACPHTRPAVRTITLELAPLVVHGERVAHDRGREAALRAEREALEPDQRRPRPGCAPRAPPRSPGAATSSSRARARPACRRARGAAGRSRPSARRRTRAAAAGRGRRRRSARRSSS